jgi:hypothetical protein
MRYRFLATLAVAATALAVPAVSQAGVATTLTVRADASSQYGSGPISSKTVSAKIGGGLLISKAQFALPLGQFDPTAAGELLAATSSGMCTNPVNTNPTDPTSDPCLGYVTVSIGGVPYNLAIDYGDCSGGIPAPAKDPSSDAYTAVNIVFTGSPLAALLGIPCLGAAVDVYNGAGTVVLTVDLSQLAENFHTIIVGGAALTVWNVDLDGAGPNGTLFMANPDVTSPQPTVDDTVTITPCAVITPPAHCDGTGTAVPDTVRETLGGQNTVSATILPSSLRYGTTAHIVGQTVRGDVVSPYETVTAMFAPAHGAASTLPSVMTDLLGNYTVSFRATGGGSFSVGSYLTGSPHSNTYTSMPATITVFAGAPGVTLKKSHKKKSHGKTTYTVTVTITAAAGLRETVKVGNKTQVKTQGSSKLVLVFKKVKKKTSVVVTSSANDVTPATTRKKV